MTSSVTIPAPRRYLRQLRANWPALLLPLVAVGTIGIAGPPWPLLLVGLTLILALLAPRESARIAPFVVFAYGAYGLWLAHALLIWEHQPVFYGFVQASRGSYPAWHTSGPLGLVLTEAVAFMAVGAGLLARPDALGGGPVRRAVAQLRGTGGQPRTAPPLLLLPVIFVWEELFSQVPWFGYQSWPRLMALLIVAVGVALVVWLPRAAAVLAVAGAVVLGLGGLLWGAGLSWADGLGLPLLGGPAPYYSGLNPSAILFYGAVPLDGGITRLFAGLQGAALLAAGGVLAPRLLTWSADAELAERARVLARRVEGLTRTRSDAAETAVAELRRIERDLHDGAQARMVAVGMSLRAAEQLMSANPDAALALVVEARETSARAIADLRDLVRGIYPPVLADRGLVEAVRNLALMRSLTWRCRPA